MFGVCMELWGLPWLHLLLTFYWSFYSTWRFHLVWIGLGLAWVVSYVCLALALFLEALARVGIVVGVCNERKGYHVLTPGTV